MKKFLSLILSVVMLFLLVSPVMAVELIPTPYRDKIDVTVGGKIINFDVKPQIINGRTMVPLRAILEALGASVGWNGKHRL